MRGPGATGSRHSNSWDIWGPIQVSSSRRSVRLWRLRAYHPIDAVGQRVVIPMLDTMRYALDFSDFQTLAQSADSHVCLLAAGAQKAEAIRAVVSAGMCNTCILDEELATALIAATCPSALGGAI